MKQNQYLFMLVLPFSLSAATIFLPSGMSSEQAHAAIAQKLTTNEIEFAFDLHGTVLEKDGPAMKQYALAYPYKWAVIANIFNFPVMAEAGAYAWHSAMKHRYSVDFSEKTLTGEIFLELFDSTGARDISAMIATITLAQHVRPGMIELLQELKTKDYVLHIASNITERHYKILKEKLEMMDENIFALFDADHNGREGKVVEKRGIAISPIKPNPRYFQEYQNYYNRTGNYLIIFIDDRLLNCKQAARNNMIAIHFKSMNQLRNDLNSLGLLP